MELNKIVMLFLVTFVGFSFAIEMDEKKEADLVEVIDIVNEKIIIPSMYKNLQVSKNCFKRLAENIEHSKTYKLFDKYVTKKANKLITENAKGIKVVGLAGIQMILSTFDVGPVVYTAQQETGNGIAQYGISKKINPKLLIMFLMGISFLVKFLCTFDTFGQVDMPPSDFNNSTDISNGTMIDLAYDYNNILNNCLIDLNDVLNGGNPTLTSNYSLDSYNSAVNNCLDNINTVINSSDNPPLDPWKFLIDFKDSFLISVYCTGLYILQQMAKSQRTITSQTDVQCMATQSDAELTQEQLDDLNFDNNTSGKLIFDGTKSVDAGCMTTEDAGSSVITTQTDSSSVSPNVTPEKLRRIRPNSPSNVGSFKILRARETQTPNREGKSLLEYANMALDEQQINLVLDID